MLSAVVVLIHLCTVTGLWAEVVYVDRPDSAGRFAPLIKNDRSAAQVNSERMSKIMSTVSRGATLFFSAGDYYFGGAAMPNHGSIESSATGQVFRGEGVGTTRILQCDARQDFGFVCREDLKRVPAATLRIRHKGCVVENMTIALDSALPSKTIAGTAALQIAHIAYYADNNVGIVETTGQGEDFLIDHVTVSRVNIGENLGS